MPSAMSRIYDKHYGNKKPSKVKKENAKISKVVKEKAIVKVNKKLAVAGLPIQFATDSKPPVISGEAIAEPVGMVDQAVSVQPKATSREQLMLLAQSAGIKYFRILNKEELVKVLDITKSATEIENIVEAAKTRWQVGMTKNKVEVANV